MTTSRTHTPLIIAFAVVLLFIVSLTAVGAYLLLSGIRKVENVVAENTRKGDLITDMRVAARLRALSLSQMLLMDDPFDQDEEFNRFNAFGTEFIVARNRLKETNLNEEEQGIFRQEIDLASQIGLIQQQIIEAIYAENIQLGKRLQIEKSIPLQRKTDNLLAQLQNLQRTSIKKAVTSSAEELRGSLYILFAMAIFIVLAILMIAGAVVRRILNEEQNIRIRQIELEVMVQERTAELLLAKEQAEQASRTKTDFLSQMSHELRTPLNAILGFSQIIQLDRDKTLTEEVRSHAIEIETAGTHLLELINDLLDLSKIESGNIELKLEAVSLYEVVTETINMLEPLARQRHIRLVNALTRDSAGVVADKLRLKQVILNVLANAIKYNTENGTVYINLDTGHAGHVRLSVKDTGQGISEQDKERVFHNFERLSANTAIEGTGIGLSVSRQLIQLMHGRIGIESVNEGGCIFWIELPAVDSNSNN